MSKVLADETCIPVDLVRSVVLRLRDRGLIDSDNRIIDRHRRKWEGVTARGRLHLGVGVP